MANENKFRLKQCEQGCLKAIEEQTGFHYLEDGYYQSASELYSFAGDVVFDEGNVIMSSCNVNLQGANIDFTGANITGLSAGTKLYSHYVKVWYSGTSTGPWKYGLRVLTTQSTPASNANEVVALVYDNNKCAKVEYQPSGGMSPAFYFAFTLGQPAPVCYVTYWNGSTIATNGELLDVSQTLTITDTVTEL